MNENNENIVEHVDFIPFENSFDQIYISDEEDNEFTFENNDGILSFYGNFNIDIKNILDDNITALEDIIKILTQAKETLIVEKGRTEI